jgi:DNA-binding CsgD family transcriptional regulator
MNRPDPFDQPFQQTLERAYQIAGQKLRVSLGAHTSEDVVSALIEKELRKGRSLPEIQESLVGPGVYRRMEQVKTDIYRWETAQKRGSGNPTLSMENDAEPFKDSRVEDPETELIRKEDIAQMKDVLTQLLEKVQLSDTQLDILNLDQQGWSNKRIARELGIDVKSVYARRSEAHQKLAAAAQHLLRKDE